MTRHAPQRAGLTAALAQSLLLQILLLTAAAAAATINDTTTTTKQQQQQQPAGPGLLANVLNDNNNCAAPTRSNWNKALAEAADLVVSGVAIRVGAGSLTCGGANGTDLLPTFSNLNQASSTAAAGNDSSTQLLLLWVTCVHKGALACRLNSGDSLSQDATVPPRCLIVVRVPAQVSNTTGPDGLLPCTLAAGFRYTVMLSSKPAAACDGAYNLASARIDDAVHAYLGTQYCSPYPTWPSQDVSTTGTGIAGMVAGTCPGAVVDAAPAACEGTADPCTTQQCDPSTGITCVAKACSGKFMVTASILEAGVCMPTFFSRITGLPVASCAVAAQRLARQVRQTDKRLGMAAGKQVHSAHDAASSKQPAAASTDDKGTPVRAGAVSAGGSRLLPLPALSSNGGTTEAKP